jgi:hypothetical protein
LLAAAVALFIQMALRLVVVEQAAAVVALLPVELGVLVVQD